MSLSNSFTISKAAKKVVVHTDGTGYVKYIHSLKVADNEQSGLKWLEGYYSRPAPMDNIEGMTFSLTDLIDVRGREPSSPTFGCRIIKQPVDRPVRIDRIDGAELNPHILEKVFKGRPFYGWHFRVMLDRPLYPKEELTWAYGFTFPNMFELLVDEWSDYRAIEPVSEFQFDVVFMHPSQYGEEIQFVRQPELSHIAADESCLPCDTAPIVVNDLESIKYSWIGIQKLSIGDRIRVQWQADNLWL